MKRSHEIDMTTGPIFSKILMFVLPLMASGILQLLFNAADVIVVGKFAGSLALAAVGSNGALINLFVNVFIGISTGANVLVARFYGSHEYNDLNRCVHCSIAISGVLGIIVAILGFTLSTPMLKLMNADPQVLPLASLYLKIYFLGIPATLVYNFGAAILRAVGDTERPLRFLIIAGVINVVLNLIFVIVFHMSVAGVGIATAVSQYVSAFLVVRCLVHSDGVYQLRIKDVRFYKDMLLRIIQIGIPAGLQSSIFSLSNVLIQSSINSFGYITMAANSAAGNLDGFIYISINSVHHAALSFTSQNYGARQYARIKRIFLLCSVTVFSIGFIMGSVFNLFASQLLSLYISSSDPDQTAIIATGIIRLRVVGMSYCLCGLMDTFTGFLRGLGKSWSPLIISAFGACVFRVVWIFTVFAVYRSLDILYLSYPISWTITPIVQTIVLIRTYKKQCKLPNTV